MNTMSLTQKTVLGGCKPNYDTVLDASGTFINGSSKFYRFLAFFIFFISFDVSDLRF